MSDIEKKDETAADHGKCMLSRRQFLMYSGSAAAAASTVSISLFPGQAAAKARVVGYPRKKIGQLSALKDNEPLNFNYPDDSAMNMLVKLGGVKAGGGVPGPHSANVGGLQLPLHPPGRQHDWQVSGGGQPSGTGPSARCTFLLPMILTRFTAFHRLRTGLPEPAPGAAGGGRRRYLCRWHDGPDLRVRNENLSES